MGITRKCDRCGQYYTRKTELQVPVVPYAKIEGITLTDITGHVVDFCLCDDCITKLIDFLAMEECNDGTIN